VQHSNLRVSAESEVASGAGLEDLVIAGTRFRESFFRYVLPVLALINLALGVLMLGMLRPAGWLAWLERLAAALCFAVAGWLAGSGWSKSYWGHVAARQVGTWQRMVDAIFDWLDELRLPADALERLKRRLEEEGT